MGALENYQAASTQGKHWQLEKVALTWTSSGFPKRRALSKFFLKASSRKLVRVILRSLYSFMMNCVAWPDGSIISGYLIRDKERSKMFRSKFNWTHSLKEIGEVCGPVEPFEHDGIFSTEVISWERVCLPAEPLICIGQVLSSSNICAELGEKIKSVSTLKFDLLTALLLVTMVYISNHNEADIWRRVDQKWLDMWIGVGHTWMLACCRWWDHVVNRFCLICCSK